MVASRSNSVGQWDVEDWDTYEVRPTHNQLRMSRTVKYTYMRGSVLGERPGNKCHWEGVGAVGDHLEWLVTVAVTSLFTLRCPGRGLHV